MKKICFLACLAMASCLIACDSSPKSSATEKGETSGTAASSEPAAVSSEGGHAFSPVKGKVAETMDAAGYTYIRIDDGSEREIWAAVPMTNLEPGEEVFLLGGDMVMENFYSSSLKRTFDSIIFATGISRIGVNGDAGSEGEDAFSGTQTQTMVDASGGSAANIVPFVALKVEKAFGPDAYSVGELFEMASLLDAKKVILRGQIVKISRNIMGKNWIHIQDGTGDAANNRHDLVVTTMDAAEKGDIVMVEGMVAADKDFGFGYQYDVIIEDARITKANEKQGERI